MHHTGAQEMPSAFSRTAHIETREMEELVPGRIGEKPLQVRRAALAGGDLNHIRRAVARRQLDDAQPVAMRLQAEGFGVDRNRVRGLIGGKLRRREVGQVTAMKANGHGASSVLNAALIKPFAARVHGTSRGGAGLKRLDRRAEIAGRRLQQPRRRLRALRPSTPGSPA